MKMVMAVVPANSAERVLDALINAGHTATYAETRGGMLRQSQYSLFIAVKADQLDEVLTLVKENCRTQVQLNAKPPQKAGVKEQTPVTADLGGAIAFIWDINRIENL
jgi:uncharacterized protein YaaQ